jgi:hypothetical protein
MRVQRVGIIEVEWTRITCKVRIVCERFGASADLSTPGTKGRLMEGGGTDEAESRLDQTMFCA